ncbi:MAG: CCA tRNA nucleotidyltransferase [Candidatus Dormibacteraeota bacterium]|nr:CCA tRNA nucleotidyltransferase [Candidatus Dormibacteraeota bacterium]
MGEREPVAEGELLPGAAEHPAFPLLRRAATDLGVRAWAVGGYVRDVLLHREHPDLDVVAETAGPQLAGRFAELAGAARPALFPRFGTAQVTWRGHLVEFVTARAESYPPDSRKPEVRPAGLEDDLRRRDFTVNTMLLDFEGRFLDPLRGQADLRRRVLRTPADPVRTFTDDPLRMLRAVRFAAQLGFQLDPSLLPAMRAERARALPPILSAERTRDELLKMLLSERPRVALDLLDEAGLLELLLPEVFACHDVEQGRWHVADVYGHTVAAVAAAPPERLVRLAALFHDVGKARTAAPDGSFHGHERVGAEMAVGALARLRFPAAEGARVGRLVALHLRPIFYSAEQWTEAAVRRLARDAGDLLWPLLDLARADIAASAYPDAAKLDDLARRLREALAERPSRMRVPIRGEDIMSVLGVGPGPVVGRVRRRLEELVLEGGLAPEREAIMAHLRAHPELAS